MMWRDEDGEVSIKLIDFGMATYQPEGELLTMSCGSPHYAAPEIMEVSRYGLSFALRSLLVTNRD